MAIFVSPPPEASALRTSLPSAPACRKTTERFVENVSWRSPAVPVVTVSAPPTSTFESATRRVDPQRQKSELEPVALEAWLRVHNPFVSRCRLMNEPELDVVNRVRAGGHDPSAAAGARPSTRSRAAASPDSRSRAAGAAARLSPESDSASTADRSRREPRFQRNPDDVARARRVRPDRVQSDRCSALKSEPLGSRRAVRGIAGLFRALPVQLYDRAVPRDLDHLSVDSPGIPGTRRRLLSCPSPHCRGCSRTRCRRTARGRRLSWRTPSWIRPPGRRTIQPARSAAIHPAPARDSGRVREQRAGDRGHVTFLRCCPTSSRRARA